MATIDPEGIKQRFRLEEIIVEAAIAANKVREESAAKARDAAGKTLSNITKTASSESQKAVDRAFKAEEAKAEAAGQDAPTLDTPTPMSEVARVGGPEQPQPDVPIAEIPRGGGGGVTRDLMAQVMGQAEPGQTTTIDTETQIPRKLWWGSEMTPVTKRQTITRPGGMTQNQRVNAMLGMAQEQRLGKAFQAARNKDVMAKAVAGAQAGLTGEENIAYATSDDYTQLSPSIRTKLRNHARREQDKADAIWEANYRYKMAQAEATGDKRLIALNKEARAQRGEARDIDNDAFDRQLAEQDNDRKWINMIKPKAKARAGSGSLQDAGIRLTELYGMTEEPLDAEGQALSKHRMDQAVEQLGNVPVGDMDPFRVYSGVAIPAMRQGMIVVKGADRPVDWEADKPGIGLEDSEQVFGDMFAATGLAGLDEASRKAKVAKLKKWGLISKAMAIKNAEGNNTGEWSLEAIDEGGMSMISKMTLKAFDRRVELANETGLPFASASASSIARKHRALQETRIDPKLEASVNKMLEDRFRSILGRAGR